MAARTRSSDEGRSPRLFNDFPRCGYRASRVELAGSARRTDELVEVPEHAGELFGERARAAGRVDGEKRPVVPERLFPAGAEAVEDTVPDLPVVGDDGP